MFNKSIFKTLGFGIVIVILLTMTHCANKTASDLPKDILGISIGMSKVDAQKRLEEIAQFESEARKVGQLWGLKNDWRFSSVAVGYDKENRIRFVTAFVEPKTAKERIRFSDVGDLTKAKAEILEPHYRYIWEIPAEEGKSPVILNIYGDNPEFVTTYSLAEKAQSKKEKE